MGLPLTTINRPLNTIGLPHYATPLFSSALPTPPYVSSYAPQKIPPQILHTMKSVDGIGYAALPKELRGKRNLAAKRDVTTNVAGKTGTRRFRSERHKSGDEVKTDALLVVMLDFSITSFSEP